jgi:hypothetical protein
MPIDDTVKGEQGPTFLCRDSSSLADNPELLGYNAVFVYDEEVVGHARLSIDHKKGVVKSVDFYPFEWAPSLIGSGRGQRALCMLMSHAVEAWGVTTSYVIDYQLALIEDPAKVML